MMCFKLVVYAHVCGWGWYCGHAHVPFCVCLSNVGQSLCRACTCVGKSVWAGAVCVRACVRAFPCWWLACVCTPRGAMTPAGTHCSLNGLPCPSLPPQVHPQMVQVRQWLPKMEVQGTIGFLPGHDHRAGMGRVEGVGRQVGPWQGSLPYGNPGEERAHTLWAQGWALPAR